MKTKPVSKACRQRPMSDLEQEVMKIVWNACPCSIKEIKSNLDKKKKLAYTTVATLVQRLENKGLLKRVACDCPSGCTKYKPQISKKKYTVFMAQSFIQDFQKSFGDMAIASFADSISALNKEKREYFLKLLSKYDKKS